MEQLSWTPYLLRYLRIKNGWSLYDVTVKFREVYPDPSMRLAKNQVLLYELGKSMPRADRLAQLANLFCVEPNFFFTKSREEAIERMGDLYSRVATTVKTRGPTTPQDKPDRKKEVKRIEANQKMHIDFDSFKAIKREVEEGVDLDV